MNLYNTTEDVIEGKYHGFIIVIGAGETKSVADDTGVHLLKKHTCDGLVLLEYGTKEEEKYGSLAEFKKSKRIEGLTNYKNWKTQCLQQEQMFPRENKEKNGGEVEESNSKIPLFKSKIKEIEALINKKDDVEVRKAGRPRKDINVNANTAQN